MPGDLFLVATPIGNLGDLSARAVETLRQVDFVVCEDTRHSRVLLDQHAIRKPLVSLPAFAEGARADGILARIEAGESAALITDAGTPAVSDPGEKLVAIAVGRGIRIIPVPGASAVLAALSASGLPTGRFHFLGFLPRQNADRRAMLEEVSSLSATLVLYESPRRTEDTLSDLREALGDRRACVARELTKLHEEFLRGTLSELKERSKSLLGEVVIVVEGRAEGSRWSEDEVRRALEAGLERGEKLKLLATEVARRAGWTGQQVYRLGVGLKIS